MNDHHYTCTYVIKIFDSEWHIHDTIIAKNFNGNHLAHLFSGIWVFTRLVPVSCTYTSNKANTKTNSLNSPKWSIQLNSGIRGFFFHELHIPGYLILNFLVKKINI